MTSEEDIMRRALNTPATKGYQRKIPFFTTEKLIEDVTTFYPAVNEIFIYNHDLRDAEDGPVLTTKNYRGLKAVITTTTYSRGYSTHSFTAKWQACFVAVENGMAFIKTAQLNVENV